MRHALSPIWPALFSLTFAACSDPGATAGSGSDAAALPPDDGPVGTSDATNPGGDTTNPPPGPDAATGDDGASADTASPLPSSCVPGETRCDGASLATCGGDGRSWTTAACPNGCAAGACAACAPNTRSCDGNTVVQCLPDGQTSQPVTTCAEGRVCSEGVCLDCTPGARRCNGVLAEVCGDAGAWETGTDCASQGLGCNLGTCVPACSRDPKARSNAGCEYWAVDMDNLFDAVTAQYAVIVSNLGPIPATVTVSKRDNGTDAPADVLQRLVAPGSLEILALPGRNMSGPGVHWAGYRISSTAPVVAYQFNPLENVAVYSNDASLLLPVDTFATEYIVMSRKQIQGSSQPFRGAFDVVASGAQTEVTITPTTRTQAGTGLTAITAGTSRTFTLEPYQVLNIKSDVNDGDLTGTVITSNRPIGVFGGHEGGASGTRCCVDHLEHQLYPVSTWGTNYIAARSQPRGVAPDYWRIVASENGTQVSFEPAIRGPVTLERGKFVEVSATVDFVINATKPVMVGQLLASSGEVVSVEPGTDCSSDSECDPGYDCQSDGGFFGFCSPPACTVVGSTNGCPSGHVCACPQGASCSCQPLGDPSLILVPPTSQYRDSYVFLAPNKYAFDYINIVAPADAAVSLDDQPVAPASFVAIGGAWKVARLLVQDGVHKVTASKPVGVIAYGFDDDVSYGYAGGLNLVDRAP
jgi:hypothetical protein